MRDSKIVGTTIEVWAPVIPEGATAPAQLLEAPALAPSVTLAAAASGPDFLGPFTNTFGKIKAYEIDMSILSNNLKQTLADFQKIMDDLPKSASGYCIDEVELNMGVNGNGGIALIGKLEVGVEAAIKIKIKRKP